jgi:uncharacterized protein involved in exopolysaccharide biosynthesis
MMHDPQPVPPIFRIDVSADSSAADQGDQDGTDHDRAIVALLRQLTAGQERQNKLLEDLAQQLSAAQRQRATEIGQWKEAHPELARNCRRAAETLSRVQSEFLRNLTDEIVENEETLADGDFMLHEFVDRFGPRLAHLNGVLQVLSQLSTIPSSSNSAT